MSRLILLVLAAMISLAQAQTPVVPPKNQTANSIQRSITVPVESKYLLFLPADYAKDTKKKWPLMLFLHGAGERGTNLNVVAVHGPPKLVQERPDFPFIVVSPQCPAGKTWTEEVILSLLDEVIESHRVDVTRIYLTGLSMGGYGTWAMVASRPELFAAVAPICGDGDPLKIVLSGAKKDAIKSLPVWAFHGGKDNVVPLAESERMVKALKDIGNDAKLTVFPEAGHDSWTEAYNKPELYDWLLQHSRPGLKWKPASKRTGVK